MRPSFRKPFGPGDVVWGPDAYHEDDPTLQHLMERPWLVISNESFPGHGQQYLVCGLTHTPTSSTSILPLAPNDWEKGGTPKPSHLDTETIVTMKQTWITRYSGRLRFEKTQQARKRIKTYL